MQVPPAHFPDLDQQVVIVTGAASGIGLEIATQLQAQGSKVVAVDVDEESLQAKAEDIGFDFAIADVSNLNEIEELVTTTVAAFGRLDALVANAALTRFAPFLETSPEDFTAITQLNLKGSFFLAQACAKQMLEQGGRILLISSNISKRAYPGLSVYSAIKAALNMLARSMAFELGPYNIRVNALAPGPTLTERTAREQSDYNQVWGELLPTGRAVKPADIAQTALFLLSESAAQINGQTIFVDGGWSGQSPLPDQ